ncbi:MULTISPECIES: thiamine pyrophosphate-dependent enzyme [Pseudothermotoga]|jgi:2-oxoglutarate ferredoxin oxidoreductase subunit beta|uniref:Thiamine pyrophosphate protein domain protein TPP-binding n=1 Tax=Pseudothermotoga lettingae (strain ATCC BAA-301 / DSM 14385 / NBRC 107922 / TMO) TaxID=416591 RepID=A8F829_PSELT|nr:MULTISPECIES: thiamine pyrophosphate-dependent enzyme [Pseudothermotoga]ABV34313.1 thiamine pyrophosphate protein domain protein TPP-binding [Pseudothermotoga lettingae TMO]KUK20624.1 MAG: Thiamine pyrophosphate protein domain protein TPP-binding [Pseudothermotoga lettingae]MDK2885015.1 2-oxoglutarate/2-oxoacid ferredoxin oxidoreductase subunit beta [Pseudothermotoga sp.]GLI48742.1 MFS transporter [Pseudothermotoga lettingae TMO]HBJ81802.1 2-oxoglutarate oxidoreductase [Pseudothermotoga sp.
MEYKAVYKMPESLSGKPFTYCPGCHHGIVHRLIAEVIDELDLREKAIIVAPVGCSVFAYEFFNLDGTVAPHGRATAVATGMKRARPDLVVFTYQGDGDLAAIGTAETIHAANRGERITTIFINNAIYGMTGGQMAPTTLLGMKTTTSPYGRNAEKEGYPVHVCEILKELKGVAFLARTKVATPKDVITTKKYIKKAFLAQIKNTGYGLVEVLSTCPTNWGMGPIKAMQWLEQNMVKEYPLGVFIDKVGEE